MTKSSSVGVEDPRGEIVPGVEPKPLRPDRVATNRKPDLGFQHPQEFSGSEWQLYSAQSRLVVEELPNGVE